MKRCPECGRNYNDDSMSFCLDDGAELLFGPASMDEPATAILSEFVVPPLGNSSSEASTRDQIHTTDRTAILPPNSQNINSKSRGLDKRLLAVPFLLAIIALGGFFGYRYFKPVTSGQINSIAVLPLENRSGSADTDYLSDGIADSLIFRLSQLPNLKVSPTSSVMRYKGKETDVAQIAKELEVDAVMSGRLVQVGDSLNISVQLVDARTKKLIWAEQYDRKMADLLATQREIATSITQKLQLRLSGDEKAITKKYTNSNEAYQLYLKGRYHWNKRTREDMLAAFDSYKKAIDLDPKFALAYAALAEAYNSMGKSGLDYPKNCIPLGKAAATRALEIDPDLAEGHSALADSLALYDWDWAAADIHFKRALELDPNISYIHIVYEGALLPAGKVDQAVSELEKALVMEPSAMINNGVLVDGYIYARRYDKAIAQARSTIELDPSFAMPYQSLGMALIANKQYDEAIAAVQRLSTDSRSALIVLGNAYAALGKRAEAEQQIARLRELQKSQYVQSYLIASIYTSLGDKEKAFAELEKAADERDCYMLRLVVDPFFDPLRDDPRYKAILKRMNLPE